MSRCARMGFDITTDLVLTSHETRDGWLKITMTTADVDTDDGAIAPRA